MCMCLSILYAPHVCRSRQRSEEDIRFSGTGVTYGNEAACGCWEDACLSQEQQVLLIAEPRAQALYYCILIALKSNSLTKYGITTGCVLRLKSEKINTRKHIWSDCQFPFSFPSFFKL